MQRASDSNGALAGALAKAQTELVKSESSLTATIREEGPPVGRTDLPLCAAVERA